MAIGTVARTYYQGNNFGGYQFVSLEDIINNFIIAYVGEGKIITKIKRGDIQFHAQRAIQELSFDTFKSTKSQEIEIPPSLVMVLPHDYVNYVKLTWIDGNGIEHIIYPTRHTSNPFAIKQGTYDDTGAVVDSSAYSFDADDDGTDDSDNLIEQDSTNNVSDAWNRYRNLSTASNIGTGTNDDLDNDIYDYNEGQRYGIEPETAQINGSYFIDELRGKIHFSSNIGGKTVILKYISDSLGTDAEIQVHKFAEEAMYKWIAYAILSTRSNVQEYLVARFKKERTAETRKAKLRLSNIKLEEITQVLRGKSKQIK